MMPAVTDIAGTEPHQPSDFSQRRRGNGGDGVGRAARGGRQPAIALTMFGVTTPAVSQAAQALRED